MEESARTQSRNRQKQRHSQIGTFGKDQAKESSLEPRSRNINSQRPIKRISLRSGNFMEKMIKNSTSTSFKKGSMSSRRRIGVCPLQEWPPSPSVSMPTTIVRRMTRSISYRNQRTSYRNRKLPLWPRPDGNRPTPRSCVKTCNRKRRRSRSSEGRSPSTSRSSR